MASNFSRADGVTPIVTFVSMSVLGIVISEFAVTEQKYKLFVILFGIVMGMLLAGMELRAIIGKRRQGGNSGRSSKLSAAKKEEKLAKYVADLFEEDIDYDNGETEIVDSKENVAVPKSIDDHE